MSNVMVDRRLLDHNAAKAAPASSLGGSKRLLPTTIGLSHKMKLW